MRLEEVWPLSDTISAIVCTADQEELLPLIVRTAAEVMDMKACTLSLLDNTGTWLRTVAAYGLSGECLTSLAVRVEDTRAEKQALAGEPVIILDVSKSETFQCREDAGKEGIHCGLYVPLTTGDRALGVITVYSSLPHLFTECETKLLCILACHAAMAIRSARLRDQAKSECDLLARDDAAWHDWAEQIHALAEADPAGCTQAAGDPSKALTAVTAGRRAIDGSAGTGVALAESGENPEWTPSRSHGWPRGCSVYQQEKRAWALRHVSRGSTG